MAAVGRRGQLDFIDDLERELGRECARAYVRYKHCESRVYITDCNLRDVAQECEELAEDYWDECL